MGRRTTVLHMKEKAPVKKDASGFGTALVDPTSAFAVVKKVLTPG